MPLEIRSEHIFLNSECTISAGNTLRIGTGMAGYAHLARLRQFCVHEKSHA